MSLLKTSMTHTLNSPLDYTSNSLHVSFPLSPPYPFTLPFPPFFLFSLCYFGPKTSAGPQIVEVRSLVWHMYSMFMAVCF